jgi:hypothetical protein
MSSESAMASSRVHDPNTKNSGSNAQSSALTNRDPPPSPYDDSAIPQFPFPGPAHNEFGPTPLGTSATQTPYAYYDALSPYSLMQADTRARRRFVVAVLWAFGVWFAFGCLVTVGLNHGWRSQIRRTIGCGA